MKITEIIKTELEYYDGYLIYVGRGEGVSYGISW